jgi:CelD/BcsL family acetyltransferase involved in cellulose biosynthesis
VKTTGIVCETLTAADELVPLAGAWDRLVLGAPRPSPFLLHAWVTAWLRHFGAAIDLHVHVAWRDGVLVGALPLMERRRIGLRIAEFVGDHGYGVQLADVLAAPEDQTVPAALLQHARRARPGCVDLRTVPGDGVLATTAQSTIRLVERLEAPVLDLRGGLDTALATLGSRKRADLRRRRRRLEEHGAVTVTVARTPAELATALEDAFRVHQLRWTDRFDGSNFGGVHGRRFHRAVLAALAEAGLPRILTLAVNGRAIAFHYAFALRDRWYLHRLAFDPAFAAYSPGVLVTLAALESAAAEGFAWVEFLGGADQYKLDLAAVPAPLFEAVGMAASPVGRAYAARRLAEIRLRRRLKRSPTLHRLYTARLAPARRAVARWRAPDATPRDGSAQRALP